MGLIGIPVAGVTEATIRRSTVKTGEENDGLNPRITWVKIPDFFHVYRGISPVNGVFFHTVRGVLSTHHSGSDLLSKRPINTNISRELLFVVPLLREPLPSLHPIGDTFRNHDRGGVGVGAGDVGHDRGIHHSQSLDPMHPTVLVNHGHGLRRWPHLARS